MRLFRGLPGKSKPATAGLSQQGALGVVEVAGAAHVSGPDGEAEGGSSGGKPEDDGGAGAASGNADEGTTGDGSSPSPAIAAESQAVNSSSASVAEIDAIFDTFDEDGGGFMDADEAKAMISGLRAEGVKAENEQRAREREARDARAKAKRLAERVMSLDAAVGAEDDAMAA